MDNFKHAGDHGTSNSIWERRAANTLNEMQRQVMLGNLEKIAAANIVMAILDCEIHVASKIVLSWG